MSFLHGIHLTDDLIGGCNTVYIYSQKAILFCQFSRIPATTGYNIVVKNVILAPVYNRYEEVAQSLSKTLFQI